MAGNEWEITVGTGSVDGRAFTGINGDGNLDLNGEANVANWPTAGAGFSARGGFYSDVSAQLRTSDRYYGTFNTAVTGRFVYVGIRLARTAE